MFRILDSQGRYLATVIGEPGDLARTVAVLTKTYPEDQPMTIVDLKPCPDN